MKLRFKQKISVGRDVLSLAFDCDSNLWVSLGSTSVTAADSLHSDKRLLLSRYTLEGTYAELDPEDKVVKKIHENEFRTCSEIEYYEISQMGKQAMKKKFDEMVDRKRKPKSQKTGQAEKQQKVDLEQKGGQAEDIEQ